MKNLDLLIPKERPQEDRFTWATVTQSWPVRIRLDGENAALDIEPDSLVDVDWLDVGRRVWCHIHGRRVIVLGQAGKWRDLALDSDWIEPPLLNGWTTYGGGYGQIRYRKRDGVVYIEGLARNTTGANTAIFTLPEGFRPGQDLIVASVQQSSAGISNGPARLNLSLFGNVTPGNQTAASTWISVVCSFLAAE